jgi:hypothetical protein
MQWSPNDALTIIFLLVGVMIVVVLYHVLFIVADLRRVLRRMDHLTRQVETVLLKPLSMTDKVLEWVAAQFLQGHSFMGKKKGKSKDADFTQETIE